MAFRFEELYIWQDARKFTSNIYILVKQFPKEEMFSLTDQMKRSSSSIPANIAEGSGSVSKKDFAHYLDVAIKSLYETVSHLQIATDLKYISENEREDFYKQADTLSRRIRTFRKSLLQG